MKLNFQNLGCASVLVASLLGQACASNVESEATESAENQNALDFGAEDSRRKPTYLGAIEGGDFKTGILSRNSGYHAYSFSVAAGQSISAQVTPPVGGRRTTGYRLAVYRANGTRPAGAAIKSTPTTQSAIAILAHEFEDTGDYLLLVFGASGGYGLDFEVTNPEVPSTECVVFQGGESGCTEGQYCQLDDAQCTFWTSGTDIAQVGTCVAQPVDCPPVVRSVCGCDGETYASSCDARAAGINIASEGACVSIDPVLPARRCGAVGGQPCGANEYCDFGSACTAGNELGYCRERPDTCAEIYGPVCGCDGNTYGNECVAASYGVSVVREGTCWDLHP